MLVSYGPIATRSFTFFIYLPWECKLYTRQNVELCYFSFSLITSTDCSCTLSCFAQTSETERSGLIILNPVIIMMIMMAILNRLGKRSPKPVVLVICLGFNILVNFHFETNCGNFAGQPLAKADIKGQLHRASLSLQVTIVNCKCADRRLRRLRGLHPISSYYWFS